MQPSPGRLSQQPVCSLQTNVLQMGTEPRGSTGQHWAEMLRERKGLGLGFQSGAGTPNQSVGRRCVFSGELAQDSPS